MASPPSALLPVLVLLVSLVSVSVSFPLSELFSATGYEVTASSVHALPDTSVILTSTSTYYPREVGLHPSVVLPAEDDQEFHLVLRVFRKSGYVVWARAITKYEAGMRSALLSPATLAVVGYPSFDPERTDGSLSVCTFAASDGAPGKCATGKIPDASVLPFILPVDEMKILMPAKRIAQDFSTMPAVVQLDLSTGMYGDIIPLGGMGEEHPEENGLYGSYSSADGTACFLTDRAAGVKRGEMTYDLLLHCFEPASPASMRSKMLANVPTFQTPRFARIAMANGQVFVSYEQTVRRARGLISEVVNHKLSSKTLDNLVWIEKNGQAIPRIIELPQAEDEELAPSASYVSELSYLRLRNGVAVRVWSALNITGRFTTRNNRILLQGSGKYVFQRPQQWVFFLGRKRWPIMRALPVASNSRQMKGVVPEEYGRMVLSDTAVSVSGRKLIAYGLLEKMQSGAGTGPLFTYDLDIPYMRM